jgi:hypothetical protein
MLPCYPFSKRRVQTTADVLKRDQQDAWQLAEARLWSGSVVLCID